MVNPQLNLIIFGLPKQAICGSSSVVEHQLPKLRVAGSTPVSRSMKMRELDENLALFFCKNRIPDKGMTLPLFINNYPHNVICQ